MSKQKIKKRTTQSHKSHNHFGWFFSSFSSSLGKHPERSYASLKTREGLYLSLSLFKTLKQSLMFSQCHCPFRDHVHWPATWTVQPSSTAALWTSCRDAAEESKDPPWSALSGNCPNSRALSSNPKLRENSH